jgi:hypothetical protein
MLGIARMHNNTVQFIDPGSSKLSTSPEIDDLRKLEPITHLARPSKIVIVVEAAQLELKDFRELEELRLQM